MAYVDLVERAAGLAVAIGSNLIVFSKVLKIKSAINALGGVAKIMQQIADRTKRGEDFFEGSLRLSTPQVLALGQSP